MTFKEKMRLVNIVCEHHWDSFDNRNDELWVIVNCDDFSEFADIFKDKFSIFDDEGIQCVWKYNYIVIREFQEVLEYCGVEIEEIKEMFDECWKEV